MGVYWRERGEPAPFKSSRHMTTKSTDIRLHLEKLKAAKTYLHQLTTAALRHEAEAKQRRSDLRYFVGELLFERLRSEGFERRRPAQRRRELQRLKRIYFRLAK